jgi:outer membrane receptor for monomeric catechols
MTWISVKERLPDILPGVNYSADVLFCECDGTRYVGSFHRRPAGQYANGSPRAMETYWRENATGCGCCSQDLDATYWMECPEAPK